MIGVFEFDESKFSEVLLHELGHSLGLYEHTKVATDIMYHTNYEQNGTALTRREVCNLQLLYDSLCKLGA